MQIGLTSYSLGNSLPVLPKQVAAILRKFGSDAHVFMAGVGRIDGFTTGNYLESTGNTNASADGAVGLVLDAAGSVGSNIGTPISTTGWSVTGGWSINNGTNAAANSGTVGSLSMNGTPLTVGAWYRVEFTSANASTVNVVLGGNSLSTNMAVGKNVVYGQCTSSGTFMFQGGSVYSGITLTSLQQVTGTHATQATTANKPTLRRTNGKYAWQFDGSNDSLALPGPLFQMADDHCVVAGASWDANDSIIRRIFTQENGTPTVCEIEVSSGGPMVIWRDNSATMDALYGAPIASSQKFVISARKIGNSKVARLNGTQFGAASSALGATTLGSSAYIGNRAAGDRGWQGMIYPIIAIKGTVSDADLKTLEKWIGSLAGVQIP